MAKCEEGYLCDVCGEEVGEIVDSDLYLRYIVGMVPPEQLHRERERHIRCNPALAQFIVADNFETITAPEPFDKHGLDSEFVRQREILITRGWRRLREVAGRDLPILEYPLPEVIADLRRRAEGG
jgi:hypothetical protein